MPLTRYRIRNEYGLADPELYKAADKDDPEALLEGVAMAGLVGVLRQLGDLAEFAAEIFHDLHEEVMATAARGHGLMARVQQLEAEFPSVEKAFLTQTDQTPFFTNAGIDWRPNLRMEQNLITRGDLPRFVMESYEECRGPPRLFLLDKFDVAGAGACLKRYTDPSVFKVEAVSFGVPAGEAQREKKNRRAKKKGARLRNGETPEVVPSTHAKLHQLFLEERVENDFSDPARLVKLKRRHLNGFPFDPKPGKSYMEKFLATPSPEQKEVHEVSVHQSPLRLSLDETGLEVLEIGTVSPAKRSSQGQEDTSPIVEAAEHKPITPDLDEEPFSKENMKVPDLSCGSQADKSTYFIHETALENGLAVDEDRETEGSLGGDGSDEFLSEVDNYMDALTTVESEMETDNDYKPKTGVGFLTVGKHLANSDAVGDHVDVRANFSDSHSFGNSSVSDNGKSISWKGRSSLSCSDSVCNSAEHAPSDDEREPKMNTPQDGVLEILGSPTDYPSVHSVNQGNEANELTYFEEETTRETINASSSAHTMNSTVICSVQTELDEIPSDYSESCSKSSCTNNKGIHLPDSVLSHNPLQTLPGDNSLVEDRCAEELVHKDPDVFVSEVGVTDLEEEVDGGSVNKILLEGEIGSPQSVTSPVSVNEEHQTDDADRVSDEDGIEGEVGSTHSEEQLPSSDTSLTIPTNSEVSDGITGQTIDLENLTERATTPELDRIEEHDSIGWVTDPAENAKGLEEISTATDNERTNVHAGKSDVDGEDSVLFEHLDSDKSGSGPVNLDEHVDASLVTDPVTNSEKYGTNVAGCLPSDLVGSKSSDFVDILEYLRGDELSQNGNDNNRVLPECPVEPEEQKIERQLAVASTELMSRSHELTSDGSLNTEVLESRTPKSLEQKTPENASVMGQERGLDASPKQESLQSPELLMPSTIHELQDTAISRNPFDSALPSLDQLPGISEEMPPLPPLPPMQWRMGKFQPLSQASQGQWSDNGKDTFALMQPFIADEKPRFDFALMQPFIADEKPRFDFPSVGRVVAHSPNPFFSITSDVSNSQHLSLDSIDYTVQQIPLSTGMAAPVTDQSSQQDFLQLDGTKSSNPYLNISRPPHEKSSTAATMATEATEFDLVSSHGSQTEQLNQVILEPTSEAKASEKILQNVDLDEQNHVEKSGSPPTTSENQVQVILEPISEAKGSEKSLENSDVDEQNYVEKSGSVPTTSEDQAQVILEPISEAKGSDKSLRNSDVDEQNYVEKSGSPPTTSEDQNVQGQTTWPSTLVLPPTFEVGKPNGSKLPRPRNPLIDAVAAHDKSKLRKVTERLQPQVAPKADERDSLLEQIRTKSFNLKPAPVARPSVQGIQGPKTNLKVAAILEKANAIRQALTGSDEDEDSDSWSDS